MIDKYKFFSRTFFIVFWVASCWGFVADELVHPLSKLTSAVFFLFDIVILLLGIFTIRKRRDLWVVGIYLVVAVLSTLILNGESKITFINGTRDFLGVLLIVPILRFFFTSSRALEFRKSFDRQLQIWLYLQAVCITFQFALYGANDHGGGTMGYGMSGLTSMCIYIVSFYLVTRHWDYSSYWKSMKENWKNIVLLYPTFLNETKVSLILFLLYFLLLIYWDRKMMIRLAYVIPVSVAAMAGLVNAYMSITKQDASKVLTEEFVEEYLYGLDVDYIIEVALLIQDGKMEVDPKEWWTVDIPRFTKIVLVMPELRETGGGTLLGAGVGQFKGSSTLQTTKFATRNEWLLKGTRPTTFFVITQLGLIGLILFCVLVLSIFFTRSRWHKFNLKMITMLVCAFLIVLAYNESFRFFNFCTILFYIALSCHYPMPRQDESALQPEENHINLPA